MSRITEKYVQGLKFNYDKREEEYSIWCAKNIYLNITFIESGDYFVKLQVHQATAHLSHINSTDQLNVLIKALTA